MIQQANKDALYFLRQPEIPEIPDIRQTISLSNVSKALPHDMIHVCFCFHDKTGHYSKFAGTAMLSIFENHDTPPHLPSITVHILHDNSLTQDNRDKFIQVAERYRQAIQFYNVEELCTDRIAQIRKYFPQIDKNNFTIGAFYRIFIPFVLPTNIEKAIYLDADIIVNLDIKELWQNELADKVFGVVSEKEMGDHTEWQELVIDNHVKLKDYFNSGVLLMNLRLLRKEEETIVNSMKFILENPRYRRLPDQNVLNYCFSSRTVKLPIKFDLMTSLRRKHETDISKKIYHYATGSYPSFDQRDNINRLYMSYFIKTPWFNEDAVNRLYESFLKVRNDLHSRMAKLLSILSRKTRAFFVEPSKIDSMKKFFSIRDDEEIIPAENEDSITKLIDVMKASKDECVFFIMTPKFLNKNFPFDLLTKEGFALDKDFVRGWEILSDAYGNPFNSAWLIRAM